MLTKNPSSREISQLLDGLGSGPVVVHADVLRARWLIEPTHDRTVILRQHMEALRTAIGSRDLWMPAFNYNYTETRRFNLQNDPSQVGPLSEHFRTAHAEWRTPTPVFSFCGIGASPPSEISSEVDPFGANSAFAELVCREGIVLFYGAPFASATIIHYVERLAGNLIYRYDKRFPGRIVTRDGTARETVLLYHVRPLSCHVEYDWDRLYGDALDQGACRSLHSNPVIACSARRLTKVWREAMRSDPFYLVDKETRKWVEPIYQSLGRPFRITDFEEIGVDDKGT